MIALNPEVDEMLEQVNRAEYVPGMLYRLSSDPLFYDAAVLIRSERKRAKAAISEAIQNERD